MSTKFCKVTYTKRNLLNVEVVNALGTNVFIVFDYKDYARTKFTQKTFKSWQEAIIYAEKKAGYKH